MLYVTMIRKNGGGTVEGVKICNIQQVIKEVDDFIVIISSQFETEIFELLKNYSLNVYKRPKYELFVEQMLSFFVYKTTPVNERLNVYKWIGEYYDRWQNREDVILSLMMDEESKDIVRKRVKFYQTGELKYIMEMPINKNQYFDREYYYDIGNSESFIDCGAWRGDTIEDFIKCVGNEYSKIYAFEPDRKNFEELVKYQNKKINVYNYATGKADGQIYFSELGTTGSFVTDNGEISIEVKCLDNLISDKVTWIKMDIEGSEYDTLQGLERIIKTYKPKLAVCIYHKCEDMFQLPIYIHKLVPEYSFKIRQHDENIFDTVLYADIYENE